MQGEDFVCANPLSLEIVRQRDRIALIFMWLIFFSIAGNSVSSILLLGTLFPSGIFFPVGRLISTACPALSSLSFHPQISPHSTPQILQVGSSALPVLGADVGEVEWVLILFFFSGLFCFVLF